MKKLFTFFVFACLLLVTSSVTAWEEPVAPSRPVFQGSWVTPAVGGQYYIYNVGSSQFMGTGLDWGTRTCTTVDSVVAVTQKQVAVALNRNYVVPFSIEESDTEGFVFIRTLNTNKGTGAYVTAEGNASWSDGDLSRAGRWYIEQTDDAFLLHPNTNESYCLGVHGFGTTTSYTWADAVTESDYSVEWKCIEATDEAAETIKAYAKGEYATYLMALDVYNARVDLLSFITEAEAAGVDVTAAGAVFTKTDVTLEEVLAATDQLKNDIFNHQIVTSSEENPFDVTRYVLQNPDFSAACSNGATPPGWEVTVKGQNLGQQNRKDTNPNNPDLYVENFIEGWIPAPQTLGDGHIAQWVSGLPQGRYRLAMDAVACNQSDGFDSNNITGVYLFAGNGTYNLHGDESVKGAPMEIQHYEWDFDFNAEKLLMGLLVENTNANWISADNFKLYAIGPVKEDPNVTVLREAIAEANERISELTSNSIEDNNRLNVNAAVAEKYIATVSDAEVALKGTTDEVKAAIDTLRQVTEELLKSAQDYQAYQEVYMNTMRTVEKLEAAGQWEELQISIYLWAETLFKDFNDGVLTAEGLEEAQGKTDQIIADFIGDGSKIQAGDDLTVLVKNADFNQGQYGPNTDASFNPSAGSIPGWNVTSGNIKELSGEWHNIESYAQAFDFNQTIKNLPAGSYRVTVQGYVRVDGGENDMELYAGISTKQFMDIADQYSETPLLADAEGNTGSWPYDTARDDGLGYQPNSMQGASVYFATTNPATGLPFYLNDVSIIHTGGDLTIGVRSARTNNNSLWIIWDNFTLTYLGAESLELILEEIEVRAEELSRLFETNSVSLDLRKKAEDLLALADQKDQITNSDEALKLLEDIKQLMADIQNEQPKYQEIEEIHEFYSIKMDETGIADESFVALLDEVGMKISNMEFQNLAQMDEYIQKIMDQWVVAVMKDATEGSDVTVLINNPDFETLDARFWNIETTEEGGRVGDNQGYQANTIYENGDIKIEHFIEAWRNNNTPLSDGDICQHIAGTLPEGYYTLEADGFALLQSGTPDEGILGVSLFAQIGKTSVATPFATEGGTTPLHYSLNFHADGVSQTTIGVRVREANFNWFVADNFRLTYLGQTAPDAVQSVAVRGQHTPAAIYTIDGRKAQSLHRGINIIRTADGQVRKVLVK